MGIYRRIFRRALAAINSRFRRPSIARSLGEYAWSLAFDQLTNSGRLNQHEWCYPPGSDSTMAYGLAAHCSTAGSEYDCSADEDAISTLYLPSHLVVGGCRLTWTGVGADYVDASSKMAAFDPSAHEPGSNALLLRLDLLERYLSEHDFEMCWAVTGEKQSTGTFGQHTVGSSSKEPTSCGTEIQSENQSVIGGGKVGHVGG